MAGIKPDAADLVDLHTGDAAELELVSTPSEFWNDLTTELDPSEYDDIDLYLYDSNEDDERIFTS
ncbi:hypothetical protein DXG03_002492, partial [Asterophora parasitica]